MSFKNFSISTKLFIGFAIVFVATIVISATSLIYFDKLSKESNQVLELVTKPMSHLINFTVPYGNLRSAMRDLGNSTTKEENDKNAESISKNLNLVEIEINSYLKTMQSNSNADPKEIASVKKIAEALVPYKKIVNEKLITAGVSNQNDEVMNIILNDLKESGITITEEIAFLTDLNIQQSRNAAISAENTSNMVRYAVLILITLTLIISTVFFTIIVKSITKPVSDLIQAVNSVSKGNLNVNIKLGTTDEIGILSNDFYNLVQTISSVVNSLNKMCSDHENGKINNYINEDEFEGEFKNVAIKINEMTEKHIVTTKEVINCITEIVDGNFSSSMPKYPGDKIFLNEAVENLRRSILIIESEINGLVESAVSGQLSKRADLKKYNGDWLNIIGGLNNVLDAFILPIEESSLALQKMAKGDLDVKISGDYKGDFSLVKTSFNNTTHEIGSYIKEINDVLSELSNNNFNTEINGEFVGQFGSIKISLNSIIVKLSDVLDKINKMSMEVAEDSKLMSQNSISLADGVTTQASSIENLNSTIKIVSNQVEKNVQNAKEVSEISIKSSKNAMLGNEDMQNMLASMKGIRDSSNNISQIIKVIDDIAFQTNLLALNAAVEAARAGVHGKGFAIVAEEVRNLAAKSKEAAEETTALIEESISKVNDGTIVANDTAKSLKLIVEDVKLISDLVGEITVSSIEQNTSISIINEGVSQISQVVQQNSISAEESSSQAQNLYEQSKSLQNLVSLFNLKN